MKNFLGLFFILIAASPILAQGECPTLVQDALALTGNACEGIGRNQVCYGHSAVELEPHDENMSLAFNAPGDLASVIDVRTIRLVTMDDLFSEWGVALMKLQANLPDTLPGENVTFVLFGDVEITDAVPTNVEPVTLTVTANNTINVRGGPSTNNAVVASLPAGQEAVADGRNTAGDWLRVMLADEIVGWVSAPLVTVNGDASLLDVVEAGDAPPARSQPPLRAFFLRTGVGDSRCGEAPGSGLLIQTPKGQGAIDFTINNVDIRLLSTAYLQAEPGGEMVVSVLEGQVQVSVPNAAPDGSDVQVWIPAGAQARVPLDAGGVASGPPGDVMPYGDQSALTGTVELLPVALEVRDEIPEDELDIYLNAALFSPILGDGCVPGGVTNTISYFTPDDPDGTTHTIGVTVGNWRAKAGTTVTFTADGDLSLEGTRISVPNAYIYLTPPGAGGSEAFAQSPADARTFSYTFAEDTDFRIAASVYIAEGETASVSMTVMCEEPAAAAPG